MDGSLVIDGESEMDDMVLAAAIAEIEKSQLNRVQHCRELPQNVPRKLASAGFDDTADNEDDDSGDDEEPDEVLQKLVAWETHNRRSTAPNSGNYDKALGELNAMCGQPCDDESNDEDDSKVPVKGKDDVGSFYGIQPLNITGLPEKVDVSQPLRFAGTVHSVLPDVTIVKGAVAECEALDLGSILCLEDRTILGPVSDTFGPVIAPFYVVYTTVSSETNQKVLCDSNHSSFLLESPTGACPSYLSQREAEDEGCSSSEGEEDTS